jgi:hypothetical protein
LKDIIYGNISTIHSENTLIIHTEEEMWLDTLYWDIRAGKNAILCGNKYNVAMILEDLNKFYQL